MYNLIRVTQKVNEVKVLLIQEDYFLNINATWSEIFNINETWDSQNITGKTWEQILYEQYLENN